MKSIPGNQSGGGDEGNYVNRISIRDGIIVAMLTFMGIMADREFGPDEQAPAPGADLPTAFGLIAIYIAFFR